jgi:hypothetical protein
MEPQLFRFKHFSRYNELNHCFTTRNGGYSNGVFESLNMGFARGDDDCLVMRNYELVSEAMNLKVDDLVLSNQVHGDTIRVVSNKDKGKGIVRESDIKSIDGLVTNIKGIGLTTFYADCVPLYFYDPIQGVIGMAHAGWKGTVIQIGVRMLELMGAEYSSNLNDILVGIGPSICENCFEVSDDVKKEFDLSFNDDIIAKVVKKGVKQGKYYIDLKNTNRLLLEKAGIPAENIEVTHLCTMCHSDLFFSHRKSGINRGSQIGMMSLI